MKERVAIVGFASSSRDQAPYQDESFDIWSLNHAYGHVPRWDAWFEIHPRAHFERDLRRDNMTQDGARHVAWLAKEPAGPRPIYCQEHYADIPASVRWPREEINEFFRKHAQADGADLPLGFYADDYWTSTPSQMIGHAIWAGYKEIHLYGIDMLQAEEYGYQRSGCAYYVAFARGRGIKVYVPPTSALCKANYVYGFSEPPTDIQADFLGSLDGNLTLGIVPERFLWTFDDTFGQITIDRFAPLTPENRQNANYFSTGPDVYIRLGSATDLRLSGRFSDSRYEDTDTSNDQRLSGDISFIRRSSAQVAWSAVASAIRVEYDLPGNPGYDLQSLYGSLEAEGARQTVNLDLGATRIADGGESQTNPLVRLEWNRRLNPSWTLDLPFDSVGLALFGQASSGRPGRELWDRGHSNGGPFHPHR